MKKLRKGEVRFVVKKIDNAHRVYDRQNGSFPYQTPELGKVLQDVAQADAQLECDRLNELIGIAPQAVQEVKKTPAAAAKSSAPKKSASVPPPVEEWLDSSELADYGDLSDKTEAYVDWRETAIPK